MVPRQHELELDAAGSQNGGAAAAPELRQDDAVTINAPGQWRFFLPHTQRDGQAIAMAEAIFSGMAELEHNCWLDVRMSQRNVAAMEEGVRGSKYFLAIVTDNGKDSYFSREMCRQEIAWALDAGKTIVPLVAAADQLNVGKFTQEAAAHGVHFGDHNFAQFDRSAPRFRQANLTTILDQVGISSPFPPMLD